jgi:hypothetical protein
MPEARQTEKSNAERIEEPDTKVDNLSELPLEDLEPADGVIACWRVFGLERDYGDRPPSGWQKSVVLDRDTGLELVATIGEIPTHVIDSVRGRWAHGLYVLNSMFGNDFAGKSAGEVQEILAEWEGSGSADEQVSKVRGYSSLWLTLEVRKPVVIRIRPSIRFLWLATPGTFDELQEFSQSASDVLDAAFIALLPELDPGLAPVQAMASRPIPYLVVDGRAAIAPPTFESKAHAGVRSERGWEEIAFSNIESAADGIAAGEGSGRDMWVSPHRWLIAAMSQKDDALRSFLFAFVGLEALTNRLGRRIEKEVVASLGDELGFSMDALTWPTPADGDQPWRNLVYRFALLAVRLDRPSADHDIAEFKALAAERNGMAHGTIVPAQVDELPGDRAIALLRKYLGLVAREIRAGRLR